MKVVDRGSALVDFVLTTVPFVLAPLSIISVSLIIYADTVIKDSAIEGARYAAMADQDSSSGCLRALQVAERGLGEFIEVRAKCQQVMIGSHKYEQVRLSAKAPFIGMLTINREIVGTATAPREN